MKKIKVENGTNLHEKKIKDGIVPTLIIPPMGRDGAIPTTVHEKKIKAEIGANLI